MRDFAFSITKITHMGVLEWPSQSQDGKHSNVAELKQLSKVSDDEDSAPVTRDSTSKGNRVNIFKAIDWFWEISSFVVY